MLNRKITDMEGFQVVHQSETFLIAAHTYSNDITGFRGLYQWGRHKDSQEAFVLTRGKGWLCTKAQSVLVTPLIKGEICVVEQGEWHRILLAEGAQALIVENSEMNGSDRMPMTAEEREIILHVAGIGGALDVAKS